MIVCSSLTIHKLTKCGTRNGRFNDRDVLLGCALTILLTRHFHNLNFSLFNHDRSRAAHFAARCCKMCSPPPIQHFNDIFGCVAYGAVDRAIGDVSTHGAVACAIDSGSNRADDCVSNSAVDSPWVGVGCCVVSFAVDRILGTAPRHHAYGIPIDKHRFDWHVLAMSLVVSQTVQLSLVILLVNSAFCSFHPHRQVRINPYCSLRVHAE